MLLDIKSIPYKFRHTRTVISLAMFWTQDLENKIKLNTKIFPNRLLWNGAKSVEGQSYAQGRQFIILK
jgi:hypothetical protein